MAQTPGCMPLVFLEQEGIKREPEELDTQAETPKDGQEGPKASHQRQPPEAGRGCYYANPGKNASGITVANDPHGEGHQDGVQAEDGVEEPDLAPGKVEIAF